MEYHGSLNHCFFMYFKYEYIKSQEISKFFHGAIKFEVTGLTVLYLNI